MSPVNLPDASEAVKRRILALANKINARDDGEALDYAVANLIAGKPSFWSTATYHDQSGCIFRAYINDATNEGNILLAVGAIRHDFPHTRNDYGSIAMLDALLPLNEAAVSQLAAAYLRRGTWRDEDELIRRTALVEGSYLPTLNAQHEAA